MAREQVVYALNPLLPELDLDSPIEKIITVIDERIALDDRGNAVPFEAIIRTLELYRDRSDINAILIDVHIRMDEQCNGSWGKTNRDRAIAH